MAASCLGASALLSVACYSLRNFSRSRLQQICRDRQNPDRFGEVLKQDEPALRACELLQWTLATIGIVFLCRRWLSVVDADDAPFTFFSELALLLLAVWFGLIAFPWAFSLVAGERFIFRLWPVIRLVQLAMGPALMVIDKLDVMFHRIAGRESTEQTEVEAFAEELQSVVHEGEREGVVKLRHGKMIQRLMEMHEEDVEAAMTPRTEIVYLSANASFEEARRIILSSGHSRIPVVGESPDDILGILYARDLLLHASCDAQPAAAGIAAINHARPTGGEDYHADASAPTVVAGPVTLADLVRDPLYIPESTSIETLLERMKTSRTHVAIVLDEYGGLTGLVTLEDLLEEIVGSIEDEFDGEAEEQVRRIDDHTIEVDARVHVDDLNEQFGWDLPEDDDFDTIGGFLFSELGRIPTMNEIIDWRNLKFTVLEADKRRLIKLRIYANPEAVEAIDDQ
ncbi:MAG: hemolysin family protein [Planctomycetaceae bacterium]